MLNALTLTFGPHRALSLPLDPNGVTTIRGRSGIGKTTILHAALFLLTGADARGDALEHRYLPKDCERVEVSATTAKGNRFERGARLLLKDGKTQRGYRGVFVPAGKDPLVATAEAAITANLPANLRDGELLRLVMAPMEWVRLTGNPGNGRLLRDFLARVLVSAADTRAEVARLMAAAGTGLRDDDAIDEKGASAQRAAAKEARIATANRLAEAQSALDALPAATSAEAPDEAAQEAARDVLDALTVHEDYDDARASFNGLAKAHEAAAATHAAWKAKFDQLGRRPTTDAEATKAASTRLVSAREAANEARGKRNEIGNRIVAANKALAEAEALPTDEAITTAEAALGKARAELAAAEAKAGPLGSAPCRGQRALIFGSEADEEHGDGDRVDCSTCQFLTDATAAAATLDTLRAAVTSAEAALKTARAGFPARKAARIEAAEQAHRAAQEAASRASEATKKAEAEEQAADEAQRAALTADEKAAAWDAAKAAEPKVPAEPKAPTAPDVERPTEDAVVEAKRVLEAARLAGAVAQERATHRARAEEVVADRKSKADAATAEAARCEHLVDAARRAPTAALRKAIAALQEHLGPVALDLADDGGVSVLVDTAAVPRQAWGACSDGEQIRADAFFRDALRRVVKRPWLPLAVDRCALNTLGWPAWAGPVWMLETEDCDLVSSAAAGAEQAAK